MGDHFFPWRTPKGPPGKALHDLPHVECLLILVGRGQAIDENGYILISTCYLPDSEAVEVVVEDNGCGISQEMEDKIFDPFFTTKDPGKGTGLGLSVSYGIVKDHNGEITFESVEHKGTRVAVTLPVEEGKSI